MEIQVDIDQECTRESSMGQNGEQQEVQLLEEREGNGVFPEDDEIVVGRAEIERYDEEEKELLRKVLNEIRQNPEKIPPNLTYNDRKKVKAATRKVNKVIALIRTESITETNIVLPAAGNVVDEMVGNKTRNPKENKTPHWRRRILEKQKALRKDLGQLNRMKRNELQNEGTKSKFERKYSIQEKGIIIIIIPISRIISSGSLLQHYHVSLVCILYVLVFGILPQYVPLFHLQNNTLDKLNQRSLHTPFSSYSLYKEPDLVLL